MGVFINMSDVVFINEIPYLVVVFPFIITEVLPLSALTISESCWATLVFMLLAVTNSEFIISPPIVVVISCDDFYILSLITKRIKFGFLLVNSVQRST